MARAESAPQDANQWTVDGKRAMRNSGAALAAGSGSESRFRGPRHIGTPRRAGKDRCKCLSDQSIPGIPGHVAGARPTLYNHDYNQTGCPAMKLKLTTVGSSVGVILNKELLARLRVGKGDSLFLSEAADGSFRLSPYDPEFERQMALAEQAMREDRDALHVLAK
jgi:putative addiction module antidote